MQSEYKDFKDQFTQILAGKGIEVEVEEAAPLGGNERTPAFIRFKGIYYARSTAGAFTACAVVQPERRLYILSFQNTNEKSIPFFPYLFMSVLGKGYPSNQGETETGEESE